MNIGRDVEQIVAWMEGRLGVGYFNLLVGGAQKNVPTQFHSLAGLYPNTPTYRVYALGGVHVNRLAIRSAISDCNLPDGAEDRYKQFVARLLPSLTPEEGWSMANVEAVRSGLPIGLYAEGTTVGRGKKQAILWMMNTVSPTMFLDRLKQAARR